MKAIDQACATCKAGPGENCDVSQGDVETQRMAGGFHLARVQAAARAERTANLARRALARKD